MHAILLEFLESRRGILQGDTPELPPLAPLQSVPSRGRRSRRGRVPGRRYLYAPGEESTQVD